MHSYWRLLLLWILIVYPSEIRKRLQRGNEGARPALRSVDNKSLLSHWLASGLTTADGFATMRYWALFLAFAPLCTSEEKGLGPRSGLCVVRALRLWKTGWRNRRVAHILIRDTFAYPECFLLGYMHFDALGIPWSGTRSAKIGLPSNSTTGHWPWWPMGPKFLNGNRLTDSDQEDGTGIKNPQS